MKKILVLVSKPGINQKLVIFLKSYFKKKAQIYHKTFSSVSVIINQNNLEILVDRQKLSDFDLVYFRKVGHKNISLAGTMALYLNKQTIPYIDSIFKNIGPAGNKLHSLSKLALNNLEIIPTFYGPKANIPFDYPYLAKHPSQQRLEGIYVIKNSKDLKKLPNDVNFIFQKFIDIKKEYRLLVLGNSVEVAHTKVTRTYKKFKVDYKDYNANITFLDINKLPYEIKDIAINSARALGLEIAGIDLIIDKSNKIWLVEVNRGPGITQDSSLSPESAAIGKYFKKLLS